MDRTTDQVIRVRDVWKRYARTIPAKRRQLSRQFTKALFATPDDSPELTRDEFWAVRDVSLDIRRGEAVGLMGANGAGKSTLLSMIAMQLLPDRGTVYTRGKTAAIINLSAGFQHSMTGRENIYLKAALSGQTKAQIHLNFEAIVDFAELGEFIDSPLSAYSSGMRMRLAFAVAVHANPDVLLIDEVLSVGDFRFRQKCLKRLNMMRSSCAFIFVSHSAQDIVRFCDRALVLQSGKLIYDGSVSEALEVYQSSTQIKDIVAAHDVPLYLGELMVDKAAIADVRVNWEDAEGNITNVFPLWGDVYLRVAYTLKDDLRYLVIGLPLYTDQGELVAHVSSLLQEAPGILNAAGRVEFRICLPRISLNRGRYTAALTIYDGNVCLCRQVAGYMEVHATTICAGLVVPYFEWETELE